MIQGLKLFLYDLAIYGFIIIGTISTILTYQYDITYKQVYEDYNLYLYIAMSIIFISLLLSYIRNWKFIILPYSLKLISQPKGEDKDTTVFIDRFVKFDRKRKILYFKNYNAIDVKMYRDNQKEILHYLGFYNKSIEIEIQEYKRKWVKIQLYELPYSFSFSITDLRPNCIYYGKFKDGNYYQPLDSQTSMITVGESGSGKSNYMNLLIYSLFINMNKIDHIFLIDLKGVELSQYNYKNTTFIDNIQGVSNTLKELKQIMYNRYKVMSEFGHKKFQGDSIYVVIDEVGTIGTYYDKKLRDSIFNDMIELFQKSRACKIVFLLFAQKIDSTNLPSNVLTNIQSRVLMKTDSDFNSNNTIGTKEFIEDITRVPVSNFNRGRLIFKDGETSNKELLQVPFISDIAHKSLIHYFTHLNK